MQVMNFSLSWRIRSLIFISTYTFIRLETPFAYIGKDGNFYLPTMKQMRLIRRHPIKQSCPWILFAIFINTVENLKIISRSISKSSYGFESIIKIFLVVEPLLSHKLWRYEQPLANYVRERHKIIKKNHPLSPHV